MGTTWQESLGRLSERDSSALDLLRLLSFLAAEPLEEKLLVEYGRCLPDPLREAVGDAERRASLLEAAVDEGLLRREEGSVSLPGEVAFLVREGLERSERESWSLTAVRLMREAFPAEADDVRTWSDCEARLPHAIAAAESAAAIEAEQAASTWLLERAATYLYSYGSIRKAKDLAESAAERARALAADDPIQGTARFTLGSLQDEFGEQGALENLQQALAIHEAALPSGHPQLVRDLVALAGAVDDEGDLAAARDYAERAVAAQTDRSEKHRFDAVAHESVAWILLQERRQDAARSSYEQAFALAEETCGADHPLVAQIRVGFALLAEAEGDLEGAMAELERSLEIASASLHSRHPQIAIVRSNLGPILQRLGRFQEAKRQLLMALDAGEWALPPDHPGLRIRHQKLASVLLSLGEPDEARRHSEEALAMAEGRLGANNPGVALYHSGLAEILDAAGDVDAAFAHYERALEIAAGAAGPDRADVGRFALSAGRTARKLGRPAIARARFELTLRLHADDPRADATITAGAHAALARLAIELADQAAGASRALGDEAAADSIRDAARAASRAACEDRIAGEAPSPLLAMAYELVDCDTRVAESALRRVGSLAEEQGPLDSSLLLRLGLGWIRTGRAWRRQGEPVDAARAFEAALSSLEPWPQYQGVTFYNLAELRDAEGKDEALDLYRKAADCNRRAGTPNASRDLATTLLSLGRALESRRFLDQALTAYEERLEILRALPERDYQGEGITFHDLGNVRAAEGAGDEAIELYREAVACKRKAGEKGDPRDLATSLLALGRALEARETYDEALTAYEERLAILRALPERDYRGEAITFQDLGDVRAAKGAFAEAIELYREALACKRKAGAKVTPREVATTLLALGRALEASGSYDEALATYAERLEILRALPERDYLGEAITLHDLGDVRTAMGAPEEAVQLYRESVACERLAGEQSSPRDLATALLALGRALEASGSYDEALATYEELLEILRALPERDHQLEGVTLHDMADVHNGAGRLDQAVRLYREAAAEKRLAEDRGVATDLAVTLLWLGRSLFDCGSFEEALASYDERLQILRSMATPDYQQEGVTLHDIGDVHRGAGRIDRAVTSYREAIERKRLADDGTPGDLATSLLAVSTACFESGRLQEARSAAEEAVQCLRSETEVQLNRVAGALALAGRAATEDGDTDAGVTLLEEADRLMSDLPDVDPLEVALVKSQLADASEKLERDGEAAALRGQAKGILHDLEREGKMPADGDDLHFMFTILVRLREYESARDVLSRFRALVGTEPTAREAERITDMLFLLARAYELTERDYDAALAAYEERLEGLRSLPSRDLGSEGITLDDLGDVRRARGEGDEARRLYERALETKRQAVEAGQATDLTVTIFKLGSAYLDNDEPSSALPLLEEALHLAEADPKRDEEAKEIEARIAEARKATSSS